MSPGPPVADAPARARSTNISRVPYLPGLDGMRAFAVVAVMVYHANSDWLKGGFLGVDVFFVISGYLITGLLIAEHEKSGALDMRNFWVRRFRRLLPALFVMMLLLSVWTALFERDALGKLRGDLIGGLAYVSNWYQIFIGAGYSAQNDFAPLRHLWSLAVEEQFYLVWPIVMALLLRKGSRRVADLSGWLFGGAVVVAVVVAMLYHDGPIAPLVTDANGITSTATPEAYWDFGGRLISKADALYLSTLSRASALLLGAAFAMVWRPVAVMRGPLRHKARMLDVVALVGFVVLGFMSWNVGFIDSSGDNSADQWLFRGGFFVAAIAALMIIMAVTHTGSWTARMLSGPTMLWIGTRSYGLYLYHWPIYQIVRNTAGTKLLFHEFVLCMVAAAIVTELSYRYIETPIRKGALGAMWRRRGQRRDAGRRDAGSRGAVLGGAFVGTALTIFAGASLATAELKQNEVARSLAEGQDQTCNVLEENCFDQPTTTVEGGGSGNGVIDTTVPPGDTTDDPADAPDQNEVPGDDGSEVPIESTVPDTTGAPAALTRLAIGDSVMQGAAEELVAAGFVVDAEESRSFSRGIDIVRALADGGQLPDELVIHLGTNGRITSDQMDEMMTLTSTVPEVLLVRNDVDFDFEEANNNLMVNAASTRANVDVLYWDGLASQCVGDCIYQDGIHLKSTGAAYYVQLINTVLAD